MGSVFRTSSSFPILKPHNLASYLKATEKARSLKIRRRIVYIRLTKFSEPESEHTVYPRVEPRKDVRREKLGPFFV